MVMVFVRVVAWTLSTKSCAAIVRKRVDFRYGMHEIQDLTKNELDTLCCIMEDSEDEEEGYAI